MAKKKNNLTDEPLEKQLWKAADKLERIKIPQIKTMLVNLNKIKL